MTDIIAIFEIVLNDWKTEKKVYTLFNEVF